MSDQETYNEEAARAFAKAVFGRTDDTDDTDQPGDDKAKPPVGNYVPREGNNPRPSTDDMREFTRALFDTRD